MLPLPTRPPDCLLLLLLLLLVVGRQTERFQAALGSVPRYKAHGYVTNYLILQREQPSEFIGEERDEKGRGVAEKEGRRGEGGWGAVWGGWCAALLLTPKTSQLPTDARVDSLVPAVIQLRRVV